MNDIKKIATQAFDEAEGAEAYIRDAIAHKKAMPGLATMYADMANQELGHAMKLCEMGETVAKASDNPEMYSKIWDWFREMLASKFADVKHLQESYKT